MSKSPICHFLIGIPGSGKSTLTAQLAKLGNYCVVSTDAIREQLYGDASIQGEWSEVEKNAISQIVSAIASGKAVIYDATNAKRAWRMALLLKLSACHQEGQGDDEKNFPPLPSSTSPTWIGWYLQTPIETCLAWNEQRDRKVPNVVIEAMYKSLQDFPPIAAEGFAVVNSIDPSSPGFDVEHIKLQLKGLSRSLINRTNRNRHVKLHSYSKLLDFERLMHLISLIIRYPGIGNLQATDPSVVEKIFGIVPEFASSVEEFSAFMERLCGKIYSDKNAIASDLRWLEQNSLIGVNTIPASPLLPLSVASHLPSSPFPTHSYSDLDTFTRLVQTIRFILHHPYLQNSGQSSLKTLAIALRDNGIIDGDGIDTVRKDIEKVLKPYKILPNFPLRDGYFAGTAILSQSELMEVFGVLQSQAKSLEDPVALEIYETFADRMARSKLGFAEVYPVRGIGNRCIVNPDFLPKDALSRNLHYLEEAIANGQLLELNRFPGGGKFVGDEEGFFCAFPLQIVFYNLAWYLGYECQGGKNSGLFRFERLDRLFMGQPQTTVRLRREQEKSLQKLQQLFTASAGIFLGCTVSDQHQFLSKNKQEREKVCLTVELWFNDSTFRFVAEGTKRYSANQMKMSLPGERSKLTLPKSMFCLKQTGDRYFPNRFQVVLPKWSLNDVDFFRWIVGFGGNVKVIQPQELLDKVKGIGEAIVRVYQD
ncbi:hypothetical protein NUACC21_60310 [Scytonema sp. NUACC21]